MKEWLARERRAWGPGHTLLALKCLVASLVLTFIPLFLRQQGMALHMIVLLFAIDAGVSALCVALLGKVRVRRSLAIGIALSVAACLSLALLPPVQGLVAYAVLDGLTAGFFWVPLNYLYFKRLDKQRNGANSAAYFLIFAVLGIILPPAGALLVLAYGLPVHFAAGALLMLIPLALALRMDDETCDARVREAVRAYAGLRTITFLEGALHYFRSVLLPIAALLFLESELEFGGFFAYLGAVALLASLWLSCRSDRDARRMRMLSPLLLGMCAASVALGLLESVAFWLLAAGAYAALDTLSSPLRLAISLDGREHDMGFWAARELFLNIGRFATLCVAAALAFSGMLWLAFLLFAALMGAYLFAARRKLAHAW